MLNHKRQEGKTLDEIRADHVERYLFAKGFIQAARDYEDVSVLDIGCGVGYGAFVLADQAGFSITAVDINKDAIDHAQKYFDHDLINFQICDIRDPEQLPISQKPHFVTAFEILEHVEDPLSIIKTIHKSTAKYLIGSVPNQEVIPWSREQHPWHVKHFTKDEVFKLLRKGGFETYWFGGQKGKRGPDAKVDIKIDAPRTHVFIGRKEL